MKIVAYIATLIFVVVLIWVFCSQWVLDVVSDTPGVAQESKTAISTYLSFISAMMTAVTAVMATVAIGIGIVAAYTFRELKKEALKATQELVAEALSQENIDQRIAVAALRGVSEQGSQDSENEDQIDSSSS